MRIENVAYKIYDYEELSPKAKEKAYNDFLNTDDYFSADENKTTLEKFAKIFPVNRLEWEYGYGQYINFSMNTEYEEIDELSGVRLLKYLWNNYSSYLFKGNYYWLHSKIEKSENKPTIGKFKTRTSKLLKNTDCVLTGFYLDMEILDPIYKFLNKPSDNITFKDLMRKCLNSWLKTCVNDYNNYYSEENFKELCMANEWEFLNDGKIY